jgi:septal ring factor EnvC (AmiA/AmiB activator)
MTRSQSARRFATVVGVIAALVLGFGSIRAAAAWTAAAAPLSVTPDSVTALQSQLAGERDRSAVLQQQLDALETQSNDLVSALDAARAQISADAGNAGDLAAQLKTAKQRLARLQATITAANRASRARATTTTVVQVAAQTAPSGGAGGGDDGWVGGDD